MIVDGLRSIGEKLFSIRKRNGLTQAQVADASGLSINTYAEIERGEVNTSIESIMAICRALHITPDDILTEAPEGAASEADVLARLQACSPRDKATALSILDAFLRSLN
ncbi:MAG: helix-turn-helix transcriptional regulator [Clostridia bacterium]|nr:helix-turn-helix transcriptional regulator [Clostridia bacterium]